MACEDFPCCGHEAGDCEGLLYGSDESIKALVYQHAFCDHDLGYCAVVEDPMDYEGG